jgi:hypothetical protein
VARLGVALTVQRRGLVTEDGSIYGFTTRRHFDERNDQAD